MLMQDKFISTTELQQNVSKTIDKAKHEDIIVIRNNKLEAAIVSIEKYNQFLEYLEWKKISEALDNVQVEYVTKEEADKARELLSEARKVERYTSDNIEKMIEDGADINEL